MDVEEMLERQLKKVRSRIKGGGIFPQDPHREIVQEVEWKKSLISFSLTNRFGSGIRHGRLSGQPYINYD